MLDAVATQRAYYEDTAVDYDRMHVSADPEHDFALSIFKGYLRDNGISSLLDVGAGTGRVSRGLALDFEAPIADRGRNRTGSRPAHPWP